MPPALLVGRRRATLGHHAAHGSQGAKLCNVAYRTKPEDPIVDLSARRNAREAPQSPGDGWIKPKHGKGMLRPWRKGETGRVSNTASRYTETQALARQHSLDAIRTLVERMRDPDGRIAVV